MTNRKYDAGSIAKRLATLAVFTALAYICVCVFRIKVEFLTFDIKDAVITVAAMLFGSLAGIAISLGVALIEMITVSGTMFYGFIMNFLSSATFSAVAGLIYKYKRNIAGAVLSLLCAVTALTAVMMVANLLITPLYTGLDRSGVAALIPKLLLPFNLTKAVMNAAIVMLIYKPISSAVKRAGIIKDSTAKYKFDKNTVIVTVLAIVVVITSLIVFFAVLGGNISLGNK